MVSSPITNATFKIFLNTWARGFDESTNSWGEYISSQSTPMTVGKGFNIWSNEDAETRTFVGKINHGQLHSQFNIQISPMLLLYKKVGILSGILILLQLIGILLTVGINNISAIQYIFSASAGNYIT